MAAPDLQRLRRFSVFAALFSLILAFGAALPLRAQLPIGIENPFSSVYVVQELKSGRFWFAGGKPHGYTRYLYHGGKTAATVTSNVVFRVTRGKDVFYFCNTPQPFSNGGERPEGPGGEIPFVPYDSLYRSPGMDTLEVRWKNVGFAYDITMRFVAEQPRHEYDDGADILLEFEYRQSGYVPPGTDLGIFLMLDGDNGTITSAVPSDHSSIMTDRGYFSKFDVGKSFQKRYDQIPEYYMTGWFEHSRPPSEVFSIHRLTGTSLGGAPLTTPNTFAIGNWKDFRTLSWSFNADVGVKQIGDVATAMRWENLGDAGLIRTAFGTTSREGNNMYVCRGTDLFGAIRTERVVRQAQINGPYSPAQFDVELWVSNVNWQTEIEQELTFITPVMSLPSGSGRVTLDPSTPATVRVFLKPHETKKVTWRVNVDPKSNDTLALLQISPFCAPPVSFKGAFVPPPPDTRPPVIRSTGNGRDATAWWTFRTFDRHPDFNYDLGLDRIEIVQNDGNNFRLLRSPDPFERCDTNVTVDLRAEVVDTTRAGYLLFRVYDCEGNAEEVAAIYTPRPDLFAPEVMRIDSLDRYDPQNYPCAVRTYEVYLEDQNNQTSLAGDAGFGTVEVLSSTNFDPIEINFDRGGAALNDFDPAASFRLRVSDRYFDAEAAVRVADYAGNADTLEFRYCTLPDTDPPAVSTSPNAGDPVRGWDVSARDDREWDRGLAEVVEITNTNMRVSPWPVVVAPGQPVLSGLTVAVVDDAWDGELTLEFRDMYYDRSDPTTHAAHSTRVQFTFTGIKDTLAPNIIFRRDLSVPASAVVFTVLVNDTHYVGTDFYRYDRGLEDVRWTLTPNMRIRTPITYTDNRRGATFQVEVIDPLAIIDVDTVCVDALDSAGNATRLCQVWPITPDGKSPLFVGGMDGERRYITGTATDNRESDRGLGSVELRNETNLKPFRLTALAGAPSANITLEVIDPNLPVSGELVIHDLAGELEGGAEQSIHTVVIPFSLGAGSVVLELPDLVEGGEEIEGVLRAGEGFNGDEIERLKFGLRYDGHGTYSGSAAGSGGEVLSVAPGAGGRLDIELQTEKGKEYEAGEELGRIRFATERPDWAEKFVIESDDTAETNGGVGRVIEVRTPGDPEASILRLAAPYLHITAVGRTVVNGECNRVLTSDQSLSRTTGTAILGMYPQPVPGGSSELNVLVRDVPTDGALLEIISPDGRVLDRREVQGTGEGSISRLELILPDNLPEGVYWVRITCVAGTDQAKVVKK